MQVHVVVVHPGLPTVVDIVVAGVPLQAEWVGSPPNAGELVDVELDIVSMLGWGDAIAMDGAEATLREGPQLRGNVEMQDQDVLTLRIANGLLLVEIDDGSIEVSPGKAIVVVAENLKVYPTGI
ncbi:hypothetical protein AB0M47_36330 [Hamadaea sp. NPDC051192]|uniref:hypothetical protein n=1 Tax=Hamadaea sp. NPDC051192 TaxID=3154940 RepID=UPI00342080C1